MTIEGPSIYPFCSPYLGYSREIYEEPKWIDPCPECNETDLKQCGSKHICPNCGYLQPCCNP